MKTLALNARESDFYAHTFPRRALDIPQDSCQEQDLFYKKEGGHQSALGKKQPREPQNKEARNFQVHFRFAACHTMVWTEEEIKAFKARMHQGEGSVAKVDDFVNQGQTAPSSSTNTVTSSPRKWKATPTSENQRADDWMGAGSPTGKKRSWTVKSVKPVIPDMDN